MENCKPCVTCRAAPDFHTCKRYWWAKKTFIIFAKIISGWVRDSPFYTEWLDSELANQSELQVMIQSYVYHNIRACCEITVFAQWSSSSETLIWGFVYRKREGKGIANYILLDANLEWDSKKITFLHFWSKMKCMAAVLQHTSSLGAFCNCQCGVKTVMGFVMFLPSCDAENIASVFLCCFNLSPVWRS